MLPPFNNLYVSCDFFIASCVIIGFTPCDFIVLIDDIDVDDGTRNLLFVPFLLFFFNDENNTVCLPSGPFLLLLKVDEEVLLSLFISSSQRRVVVFYPFSDSHFAMKENI